MNQVTLNNYRCKGCSNTVCNAGCLGCPNGERRVREWRSKFEHCNDSAYSKFCKLQEQLVRI